MTTGRQPQIRIAAREKALVDGQCLLQGALNDAFGNPRDYEESDPKKTHRLFEEQRRKLGVYLNTSKRKVDRLFADDSKMSIKDLAEALHVLGFSLEMKIEKLS